MAVDLHETLAEYRAGLDAELTLLRQLDGLSLRNRTAVDEGEIAILHDIHTARDRAMAALVAVEHDLAPLRAILADHRHLLQATQEFHQVAALHREAAAMVNRIIASDRESMAALEEAELARRAAATAMERGETTLQAYRRVIAPAASNASLVNRRG